MHSVGAAAGAKRVSRYQLTQNGWAFPWALGAARRPPTGYDLSQLTLIHLLDKL